MWQLLELTRFELRYMSLRLAQARNSAAPSRKVTVADRSGRRFTLKSLPPLITDSRSL